MCLFLSGSVGRRHASEQHALPNRVHCGGRHGRERAQERAVECALQDRDSLACHRANGCMRCCTVAGSPAASPLTVEGCSECLILLMKACHA